MKIPKKRNWQLYTLIILFLLLIAFYLYSFLPQSETARLTWNNDENILELHLTAKETIKGWETEDEDVVYFFVPSYVMADKISLDTGLKWTHTDSTKTALQYDTIQEILLCNSNGNTPPPKKNMY